jgi:polyamine oxidase
MRSLAFDDGDRRVPGGLDGPVERVVVIGAGMAGLTVANALAHAGVECLVLEGRDRTGGRLHTADLGGWPIDLGGSWIHSPVGNPMTVFADLAGVARRIGDPMSELAGLDREEGRLLTPAELEETMGALDRFQAAADELRGMMPKDGSLTDAVDRFVAARATGVSARRLRDAISLVLELDSSAPPEEQSLESFPANTVDYDGDYLGDLPVGGYGHLCELMGNGVEVRLGQTVESVTIHSGGVRVRTAAGLEEECSHVVVTVPLGVLQRGGIAFDPPLPPERVAAIGRLGFGIYEKVCMLFEEPFWRAEGIAHLVVLPSGSDAWAPWFVGLDAFEAGPILVAHTGGRMAEQLNEMSEGEAVARLRGLIGEATGGAVPEPTDIIKTAWAADPYAGGAYTYLPRGASRHDLDAIGEPIAGRLLFAGEATGSARTAFADGAMTTGIREAKRLTGAPDVLLGLPD